MVGIQRIETDEDRADELRIELTPDESNQFCGTVAITFLVDAEKICIHEHWGDYDKTYSDGDVVVIPLRVWREALSWIARKLA